VEADNDYLKRNLSTQMSCLLQYLYKHRRLHGDLDYVSNVHPILIIRRVPGITEHHVLIIDTGGGTSPTITSNAWKVTHRYNTSISITGYQSKDPPINCAVVNAVTKAFIPGRMDPVIFEVNYATLIQDTEEFESLVVPFDMMRHGAQIDIIPTKYGGTGAIKTDDELLPYLFDDEKLYWRIMKPTRDDMDTLRWFELNPPALEENNKFDAVRRRMFHMTFHGMNGGGDWLCCRRMWLNALY
jgi:hypothetical protein